MGTTFAVVFVLLTSVLCFSFSYIPFWLLHSPLKILVTLGHLFKVALLWLFVTIALRSLFPWKCGEIGS